MNLSTRSHRINPSLQIILLITTLLLSMGSVAFCAEASNQVTFGNYSVELPASWTLKKEDDVTKSIGIKLSARIPGEGTTAFFAHIKSGKTAEVVMQEIIAKAQKEADFKLVDEDKVSTKAGKEGQLAYVRHKRVAGLYLSATVFAVFQMLPDEVVVLAFDSMYEKGDDPLKKHQEAINAVYSSLKTTASAPRAEGSVLSTPAGTSKGDSKTTDGENSEFTGTYAGGKLSMVLKADGTFVAEDRGKKQSITGTYTRDGTTLRFKDPAGETFRLTIDNGVLVVPDGTRMVKKTDSAIEPSTKQDEAAPAAPRTAGTRVTFATNCSVELPSGWTGKAVGPNLEGKGPDGAILHGSSIKGADVEVHHALALRSVQFKTRFKEVDTDDVSTKAGAKGKLVFYRYDDKGGPTAELDVLIKGPDQVVTLKFIAPNTPGNLDDNFSQAVEDIFSSLKITE